MPKQIPTYLHLAPGAALPALALPPFVAIVLVEDEVDELWMFDAARWLVASGVRYALAWGRDGDAWHDAIDDAGLEAFDYGEIPDEQRLLSTWHEDEDLEDVFWFAKHRAAHPHLRLDSTLILHVAALPAMEKMTAAYEQA